MSILRSPELEIADQLARSPTVARLIGFRIFPILAPESAVLPFATWRRQAIQREMTLGGSSGVATVTLVLELYALTYSEVRDLADQCRAALDGWRPLGNNAVGVRNSSLQGESDGIVQLQGGEVPPVYSVTQTYTVLWGPE